jgi:hypothetical protein
MLLAYRSERPPHTITLPFGPWSSILTTMTGDLLSNENVTAVVHGFTVVTRRAPI